MRHSDIDLTMNVYTDPPLLVVHGALDVLPALPLSDEQGASREALRATGTDTYGRSAVALFVALTNDKRSELVSIPDKTAVAGMVGAESESLRENAVSPNKKGTFTQKVSVPLRAGEGIRTPDVQLGKLAFYH